MTMYSIARGCFALMVVCMLFSVGASVDGHAAGGFYLLVVGLVFYSVALFIGVVFKHFDQLRIDLNHRAIDTTNCPFYEYARDINSDEIQSLNKRLNAIINRWTSSNYSRDFHGTFSSLLFFGGIGSGAVIIIQDYLSRVCVWEVAVTWVAIVNVAGYFFAKRAVWKTKITRDTVVKLNDLLSKKDSVIQFNENTNYINVRRTSGIVQVYAINHGQDETIFDYDSVMKPFNDQRLCTTRLWVQSILNDEIHSGLILEYVIQSLYPISFVDNRQVIKVITDIETNSSRVASLNHGNPLTLLIVRQGLNSLPEIVEGAIKNIHNAFIGIKVAKERKLLADEISRLEEKHLSAKTLAKESVTIAAEATNKRSSYLVARTLANAITSRKTDQGLMKMYFLKPSCFEALKDAERFFSQGVAFLKHLGLSDVDIEEKLLPFKGTSDESGASVSLQQDGLYEGRLQTTGKLVIDDIPSLINRVYSKLCSSTTNKGSAILTHDDTIAALNCLEPMVFYKTVNFTHSAVSSKRNQKLIELMRKFDLQIADFARFDYSNAFDWTASNKVTLGGYWRNAFDGDLYPGIPPELNDVSIAFMDSRISHLVPPAPVLLWELIAELIDDLFFDILYAAENTLGPKQTPSIPQPFVLSIRDFPQLQHIHNERVINDTDN